MSAKQAKVGTNAANAGHSISGWNLDPTDPLNIGLFVAILVIVLTTLYLLLIGRKKGRSVLLVGPLESGKTSIFLRLLNSALETVTSTVANEGEYRTRNDKSALQLIDLPGHDRVRNKWWETHKSKMRGIVCVVDAAGGSKAIREAAEVLYWILTDSSVTSLKPKILILANKQDLPLSKGEQAIKIQLEKELSTLKLTKSASLQSTGGANTKTKTLGKPNCDFDFSQMAPIKVDFGKSCARPDDIDLKDLLNWLDSTA